MGKDTTLHLECVRGWTCMADKSDRVQYVSAEEFERLLARPSPCVAVATGRGEVACGMRITFGSGSTPTTLDVDGVQYRIRTGDAHVVDRRPTRKRGRDDDAAAAARQHEEAARQREEAARQRERHRESDTRDRVDSKKAKAIARGVPLTPSNDSCSVSQRGAGPDLSSTLFLAMCAASGSGAGDADVDVDDSVGSDLYKACMDAMCAQTWLPSPPGYVRTATGRGVGAEVGSWSFPAGREPRLGALVPRLLEELRTMGPPQRVGDSPLHCVFSPFSLLVRVAGQPHAVDIFDDPKVVRAWQDRLLRDAVLAALGTPAQRAPAASTDTVTFRGTVLHVGTVIALPPAGEIVPYPTVLSALDTIKVMGNAVLDVPPTSRTA
jgi:hypothetical protein